MTRDMPPRDMARDMTRDMPPRDMARDMTRDMPPRDMARDMTRDMTRETRDTPRETPRNMSRETRDMPRETPRAFPSELDPSTKKELHDQLHELYQKEDYVDNDDDDDVDVDDVIKKPQVKHQNPYYLVGIICVSLFVLMLSYKFLRKK
jgi:hypothetical protein